MAVLHSHPSTAHVIRTPDQRLRVFISSTIAELAPERLAVREAVESLRLQPILFEFGARPHPPQELYRAYLEQSHVFVGIYWRSYGWVGPGMQISGIHDEYVRASGMPRLLYVKQPAEEREQRLEALIRDFQEEGQTSYMLFRDADELRGLVEADLASLLSERFLEPSETARAPAISTQPSLPFHATDLIGREQEIAEIQELMDLHRFVTITGPGGIGKTRIALEVVRGREDPETEGPWFVDLSGVSRGDLVLPAVEQALGVVAQPGQSGVAGLASVIGGRRLLLVLDNCEHVIDEVAALLIGLCGRCPELRLLCTSRQPLRIQSEYVYPLPPLPIAVERPDGTYTPGDAMRLMEQRARVLLPGFHLDADNRDVVRSISTALDGLPLAIELAAARLRVLTLDQLAQRLDARFDLLSEGPRDLPDRQRALAATIDWSFDLLSAPEQKLFLQLSVFRGGFEFDAISGITGLGDFEVLNLFTELFDKSLITVDNTARRRYRLLESLREYAQRRLPDEERRELELRHLHWVSELTATLGPKLFGADAPSNFIRLEDEQDNVRAALTYALERGEGGAALQISGDIGWFWYRRGQVAEGRRWIESALEATHGEPHAKRALALISLAGLHYLVGEFEQAADLCIKARAEAERYDDVVTLGRALTYEAYFTAFLGDLQRAESIAMQARDLGLSKEEPLVHAEATIALGQLMREQGQPEEAERVLLEGTAVAREYGNRWLEGSSLWIAAKIALELGDVALALDRLRYILRLQASEGDITSTLVGLHTTAAALAAAGKPERGAMLLGAIATIGGRIGYFPERMDAFDGPQTIEQVRAALDEDSFARAFADGQQLGLQDALTLAGYELHNSTDLVE